jgi:hypothetical protein
MYFITRDQCYDLGNIFFLLKNWSKFGDFAKISETYW